MENYQPICMYCIKCLGYTHFRAIQVTHLHDEMGWCSYNNSSGLTLQHTVFHAEAPLSNTYEVDMIFAGMTFSSLSLVDAQSIPTQNSLNCIALNKFDVGQSDISSCGLYKWVSFIFLLDYDFIRKPKPCTKDNVLDGKTTPDLIVQYSARLHIKDISNLPFQANGLNKLIAIYLK